MYWQLLVRRFQRGPNGGRETGPRSGTVTGLIIFALVVGAVVAYVESGRGNYHKIKMHVKNRLETLPVDSSDPRPGGQDPIVLARAQTPGGKSPEFMSVTLLPGRGLNVLQIDAFLPGQGEVGLLDSTSVANAAAAMTGVYDDSEGGASLHYGAPFLVPWAGRLAGINSVDGKMTSVTLHGQIFDIPANSAETSVPAPYGGLLLKEPAASMQTDPNSDGGSAQAVFSSSDLDDRWPSKVETTIHVQLTRQAVEMTVSVRNIGDEIMPVGIGWAPHFLIQGNDRGKVTLHLPATVHSVVRDSKSAMPSGKLQPVAGTVFDYTAKNGVALGDHVLADTFTRFGTGPEAAIEMRDPLAKFGLRLIPLSSSIKAIHVFSPAQSKFVSIDPQMNLDDPFGHQWPENVDTGMAQVEPGQTVEWKIRLELFSLIGAGSGR